MKIDADLRAAVRSRVAISKKNSMSWKERQELEAKAVENFLNERPALKKKLKALAEKKKRINQEIESIDLEFGKVGIRCDFKDYNDSSTFVEAGGILPTFTHDLNYDFIIAELAKAPADERNTILQKYGINWE